MQSREEESAGGIRENRLWWRAGGMGGAQGDAAEKKGCPGRCTASPPARAMMSAGSFYAAEQQYVHNKLRGEKGRGVFKDL